MKIAFRSLFAALAIAGASVSLNAEPAVKVATVDMDQLFEKYYKSEAEQAKLQEDQKRAKTQLDAMVKEREDMVAEANALQEQVKNPVLSDEARKKAEADLQAKVGEIRGKEQEIQGTAQQAQQIIQKRWMQFQQKTLEEISAVAAEIAKKKGATIVLNQGAQTVVIYADPGFSITEEVLAEINKDRPAPAVSVNLPEAGK